MPVTKQAIDIKLDNFINLEREKISFLDNNPLYDLGFLTYIRTYSKDNELFYDTTKRYIDFFIKKFPFLEKNIKRYSEAINLKLIAPSMRLFQFAGEPIERENVRAYNCSFTGISSFKDFADILYILCCGCGAGISVQQQYIKQLPYISEGKEGEVYVIPDTKEGWGDSIINLLKNPKIQFDYSLIRKEGTPLSTGGRASGPKVLQDSHEDIRKILLNRVNSKLTSVDVSDIACLISRCVVSGGVRRSSIIILFDDDEMLNYKNFDKWWETHEYRSFANISKVIKRNSDEVEKILNFSLDSFSGEPGIVLVNKNNINENIGCNPCGEISLKNKSFCNLCEIIVPNCHTKEDFYFACEASSFFGTLQASLTDFHYISKEWIENAKKESLIGISMTGQAMAQYICSNKDILRKGVEIIKNTNRIYSSIIGINPAKRLTTVKPSGTTSCVYGVSSGIHAAFSEYCIRRIRVSKNSDLGEKLLKLKEQYYNDNNKYNFIVEDNNSSKKNIVLQFPVKFENAIYRKDEKAIDLLNRVKFVYENWIKPGHIEGQETNNVSVTIFYKPEEKEEVKKWLMENQDSYRGVSVLPYDGGVYELTPFEEVTYDEYLKYLNKYPNIDWEEFVLGIKPTNKKEIQACSGNGCEVNFL